MTNDQYIIVRVSRDPKQYTWWVVDGAAQGGLPSEPQSAGVNRTTSASTLASAVQSALPTLST